MLLESAFSQPVGQGWDRHRRRRQAHLLDSGWLQVEMSAETPLSAATNSPRVIFPSPSRCVPPARFATTAKGG